jgi:hypothetical protein
MKKILVMGLVVGLATACSHILTSEGKQLVARQKFAQKHAHLSQLYVKMPPVGEEERRDICNLSDLAKKNAKKCTVKYAEYEENGKLYSNGYFVDLALSERVEGDSIIKEHIYHLYTHDKRLIRKEHGGSQLTH